MARGTPRTISLPPDDMIKLGEEMVEWVKSNNPLHLSEWYSLKKMYTEKQWDTFQQRAEFIPYYEQALHIVGLNYLNKNSDVRDGISQRWQRIYFKDLRKLEDQELQDKLDRELEQKKRLIDYEKSKNSDIPPLTDQVDQQNANMILQAKLDKALKIIEELKPKDTNVCY